MADIRAIAEIWDDRKKFRRWKRVFRDLYAVCPGMNAKYGRD